MLSWREAMQQALYGRDGFYRTGAGPAAHFRTSVHAGGGFAEAMARLLVTVDTSLGRPARLDLVDVGAGRGELVVGVLAALTAGGHDDVRRRLRTFAVEVAPRPAELDERVDWATRLPVAVTGLVVANEWLDNVPLDVVEQDGTDVRLVVVDPATGEERLGGAPTEADRAWLDRWWPLPGAGPGGRAEVGTTRDSAWAAVVSSLAAGLAVAVDYAHTRADRVDGLVSGGTLAAFRAGRAVRPVPDGSCDITAHVALDACAAAGQGAGAEATLLADQRAALLALGVRARRPPLQMAYDDPRGYARLLQRLSDDAELLDPSGLGGFGWLAQAKGIALPEPLAALRP